MGKAACSAPAISRTRHNYSDWLSYLCQQRKLCPSDKSQFVDARHQQALALTPGLLVIFFAFNPRL